MSSDASPAVVATWQPGLLPGCPACCPPCSPAHGASCWPPRQVLTPALPPQLLPPCSQEYGGSEIRPEATGYGAVLFVENVLKDKGESLKVRPASAGTGTCAAQRRPAQCCNRAGHRLASPHRRSTLLAPPHPTPRPPGPPAGQALPGVWRRQRGPVLRGAAAGEGRHRAVAVRLPGLRVRGAGRLRLVGWDVWINKPECGCCGHCSVPHAGTRPTAS